jgi:hypothetical protein
LFTKSELFDLRNAFYSQRHSSICRGILFLLTFEKWLKIWVDSGHLSDRGRRKGQYCMARFGDIGPYATNNVRIITNTENNAERKCSDYQREVLQRPRSPESNLKRSNTLKGRIVTEEHREKLSIALTGRKVSEQARKNMSIANKGRTFSEETLRRMSEGQRRRQENLRLQNKVSNTNEQV